MPLALIAVQVVLPLTLIAWLVLAPSRSVVGLAAQAVATGALLVALVLAGLWLFPPWWTPYLYGALYAAVVVVAIARRRGAPLLPAGGGCSVLAAAFLMLGLWAGLEVARAMQGWAPPAGPAVDLAFPLRGGEYMVVNGGTYLGINAHADALDQTVPARRAWRGTAYGIDLVKLGRLGTTAAGIAPADPAAHHVFGEPVLAPCAGRVVRAIDGLPDMRVPEADAAIPAGNHAILRCGAVDVVLAHFRRGRVRVAAGDTVAAGSEIAQVGNSGESGAPHLHIHAQRPGTAAAPMSGAPVPMRFDGRFLARNDRVRAEGCATPLPQWRAHAPVPAARPRRVLRAMRTASWDDVGKASRR